MTLTKTNSITRILTWASIPVLLLPKMALAVTTILDDFISYPSYRTTYSYSSDNSVIINTTNGTATVHHGTYGEFGLVYTFTENVLLGALTTQTYLEVPILTAVANSLLWINVSYEGGGPNTWSGTRSFVTNPVTGGVVTADLTYALNQVNLGSPATHYHSGFYEFRLFVPNGNGPVGDTVIGPPRIVGAAFTSTSSVPEPGTFLPAALLVAGALLRRRRPRSHRSSGATA